LFKPVPIANSRSPNPVGGGLTFAICRQYLQKDVNEKLYAPKPLMRQLLALGGLKIALRFAPINKGINDDEIFDRYSQPCPAPNAESGGCRI
jgi:hypothetical protein